MRLGQGVRVHPEGLDVLLELVTDDIFGDLSSDTFGDMFVFRAPSGIGLTSEIDP